MRKVRTSLRRARAFDRPFAVDLATVIAQILSVDAETRDREDADLLRSIPTVDQIAAGDFVSTGDEDSRVVPFPGAVIGMPSPRVVPVDDPSDEPIALQIAPFAPRRIDDSPLPRGLHRRVQDRLDPWITSVARSLKLPSGWVTAFATGFAFAFAGFLIGDALFLAAISLTISGLFELVDAAVAKEDKKNARRAVFVDYVADRFSDIAIFGGIAIAFMDVASAVAWISLATLLLAMVSSYARAQALALRFPLRSLGLGRFERFGVVLVGVCLAALPFGSETAIIGASVILAGALTLFTLGQRLLVPFSDSTATQFAWEPHEYLPLLVTEIVDGEDLSLVVCETEEEGPAKRVVEAEVIVLFQPDGDRSKVTLLRRPLKVNLRQHDEAVEG